MKLSQAAFDAEWADLRSPLVAAKGAVDMAQGVSNPVGEDEPSHPLSAAQQVVWFDATRLVLCGGHGLVRQRVLPRAHVSLTVRDFSSAVNAEGQALAYMQEVFSQPFQPLVGLLWDTRLVVISPARCYWLHRYHHLVTDALGACIFWHARADAYSRPLAGHTRLPAAAPSYRDFIKDDQNYLASARFEQDAAFWCERHADLPPPLFERARTRALGATSPTQQVRWTIERAGFNRLIAFAAEHGYSITHLLTSVLSVYFSRVSGVGEVVIGLPVHNRASAKLKRTFGMFSSISPIGVAVDPGANFVQLMGTVAAELRRCYRHQRFPIVELNRRLKLAQAGRRQLFDITLSDPPLDAVERFGDAGTKVITMTNGYEQTPLAIYVGDSSPEDDVTVDFNFNTSVLNLEAVERIQQHVDLMLKSVVDLADLPVARLPLMDGEERERVLHSFNATAAPLPEALVHTLFEQQAERTPEATALVFEDTTLSYAELNARANRLAHHLIGLGLGPDQRVAITLQRSPALVIAMLATLKAGAAYVPLDPDYPIERQAFMLDDCRPHALLTQSSLQERLPACRALLGTIHVLDLDAPGDWDRCPGTNPDPSAIGLGGQHLACVIYTAGSTGEPKGVMVAHRAVCNLTHAQVQAFGIDADSRVLRFASMRFDACVSEVMTSLCSGACLVLAEPGVVLAGQVLQDLLARHGVSHATLPPVLLAALPAGLQLAGLTTLVVAGEACPAAVAQRFGPGRRFINAYGPTESTVCASLQVWAGGDGAPNIGRPIANTRIYILDAHGEPVPVGVPGEIHIGGAGVAHGYLNRPELTAERFLPDPFSPVPGGRSGTHHAIGPLGAAHDALDRARQPPNDPQAPHVAQLAQRIAIQALSGRPPASADRVASASQRQFVPHGQ